MRFCKRLLMLIALLTLVIGLLPLDAQSNVTLVVWDSWTSDAEQTLLDQLDRQLELANPGVTVQREANSSADLASLLPNTLAQPNAPDIVMIKLNQTASLVQARLLLPLGDYADEYDWWDRSGRDLQRLTGISGELYSVPVTAEMVVVFYNKAIFSQLNLSVPLTWDDLEADLITIKNSGFIPMTFGNADGSAGVDMFGALAYAYSDIQDINGLISHTPGAAFLTEGNLEAAQNLSDWIDKGDVSPNFSAIDNDTAFAEFTSGKSALWLTSSNHSEAIVAELGDQTGFFLLPSPIGDATTPTIGGFDLGYAIPIASPNAGLAVQYIDYMTNSETAKALLVLSILPATIVEPIDLTNGTPSADLVNAWTTLIAADKIGQPLDSVLPNIAQQIQALAAHKLDAEAFVNAVQQDYEAGQ